MACALLTLAPLLLALPTTASPTVFEEDWESGLDGWTVTGDAAAVDCGENATGCSLRLAPLCCDAYTQVSRDLDLPLDGATAVSLRFKGDDTWGDTDTELQVDLNAGGKLWITLTDWWAPNNRVTLTSDGYGEDRDFVRWTRPDTWYTLTLVIHPGRDLAWLDLHDENGTLLGTSAGLDIPAASDTLTSVTLRAVAWTGFRQVFHYDDLRVGPATFDGPTMPARFRVAATARGELHLSWEPPAYDGGEAISAYRIYRGPDADSLALHATLANATPYNDTGLGDGATYTYAVQAVTASGRLSPLSRAATATTWDLPMAPSYADAHSGATSVELEWAYPLMDGGADVESYRIYRGTTPDNLTLLATRDRHDWYHTDRDVTVGTTYYYRITATNAVGEGPPTDLVEATPGIPLPPSWVHIGGANHSVNLEWRPIDAEERPPITHYVLHRIRPGENATFILNGTTFTDTGLTNNVTYHYEVRAVSSVGTSDPSYRTYVKPTHLPGRPLNFTAAHLSDGTNRVTWSAPRDNPDAVAEYRLFRATPSSGWKYTPLATLNATTLAYTDETLAPGAAAFYRLTPANAANETGPTIYAYLRYAMESDAPRNLTATAGQLSVTLAWEAPKYGGWSAVTQYCVYRSAADLLDTRVACVNKTLTTYTDRTLVPGVTYTYWVTAKNGYGESAATSPASASPTLL